MPEGWLLALCVTFLHSGTAIASNTHATPTAHSATTCDIAPRSREEIAALLADPTIATPAATTAGQMLPEGNSISTEAADTMRQIVRTWLACQNAGEPLRAWALFSDGYLYRLLSREGMPGLVASPSPTQTEDADGGASLVDIQGARRLPDGRHGAIVTIDYPSVPTPKTFFFYFTETNGRLLIDGILGEISFSVP